MVVVITNKLKEIIENSKLKDADCKYAVGNFSTDDCIHTLSSYEMDYLIIDITALRDAFEIGSWKKFRDFFEPEKTILLLEEAKSYSNVDFLSMLVTMGFYNFTKTAEGILRLMQFPNSYKEVSKYQQMALALEDRKEKEEEQISDYQRKLEETQEMMKEFREKYQSGEIVSEKKDDTLKEQIIAGLIVLPILTFLSVMFIYFFQILISNFVPNTGDYVGEYLYGDIANTGFTPLTLIGIFLSMILFAIYYTFLNAKIKRRQKARGKFIILPFAIYCILVFGDYYLLGLAEKIYQFFMFIPIEDKAYLVQDLHDLSRWVTTVAIMLYYGMLWVNNSKTLKFERDLSQNFTFIEKFWIIDLIFLLFLPLAYQISRALSQSNPIYQAFSTIYDQPLAMMLIVGLEIILTVCILLQPKFIKEKEYVELKEEDL